MTTKISTTNIQDTALTTLLGPKIATIVYPGTETATDTNGGETINLTGTGFSSGCSVLVNGQSAGTVTFINSTQISFTAPAATSGTYVIYVINPDGGTAISIPGISYSGTPTWSTTAGTLGTVYETSSISTTLTATGDAPISYTLASGTLPTGSTLNSSTGLLSGTAPVTISATTYNFTIQAKDAQNQTTNRAFSLTINPDTVTWSSPTSGQTYSVYKDQVMANVTMSATSAAGGSITYTADTLPTGLSISGANIAGTPTVVGSTTTTLTATSTATRSATRTINWVVSVANDTYFKNTTLLLNGETTVTPFISDASSNSFGLTISGDTKPVLFNPYQGDGYYGVSFNGSTDRIVSASPTVGLSFGTSDFTIECWVYKTVAANAILLDARSGDTATAWACAIDASNYPYFYDGTVYTSTVSVTLNSWTHLAFLKTSGVLKMFINGVQGYTASYGGNLDRTAGFAIGSTVGGNAYYTGQISNLRVVKGTAVYTSAFTPPTSPLTAIANTSLLTCQSNRFIDKSTNAYSLTLGGSPIISPNIPFTPNSSYSTYGSTYFDGSGDYLSVASNAALTFGTGDFTIEGWHYLTAAASSTQYIFDCRNGGGNQAAPLLLIQSSNYQYYVNGNYVAYGGTPVTNTWTHFALVKTAGSTKLYINGGVVYTYSDGINYTSSTIKLGTDWAASISYDWQGYISNFRIVKGTAVYTTTFTPPTTPLTAIANTSLLTLQYNGGANNYGIIDNGPFNNIITRNGNSTQGSFSPYSQTGWSTYFNGTSNWLAIPTSTNSQLGTGNFTIEVWLYALSSSGVIVEQSVIDEGGGNNTGWILGLSSSGVNFGNASGTTWIASGLPSGVASLVNRWAHVALVRTSTSNISIYVDGQFYASTSTNVDMNMAYNYRSDTPTLLGVHELQLAGSYYNGYMSNFRMVKGTALYTTNFTPPTSPLTPISGTGILVCQSNRHIDNGPSNAAVGPTFGSYTGGSPTINAFGPFGSISEATPLSYSNYFNGSTDILLPASSTAFAFGSGVDFTVEGWIYLTSYGPGTVTGGALIGTASGSTNGWYVNLGQDINTLRITSNASGTWTDNITVTTGNGVPLNQWTHLAFVRNGGTLTLYKNGVSVATTTGASAYNFTSPNNTAYIGYDSDGTYIRYTTGYISNVRVVKGTALYTSTFTPSTTPLTAVANTVLLTCQSTKIIDNSTNNLTITASGSPTPYKHNPFGYTAQTYASYTPSIHGGSCYFDGTGDYLTIPTSTNLDFSTGDFTIEAWVYPNSLASDWFISSATGSGGFFFGYNSTAGGFGWGRNQVAWDYQPVTTKIAGAWQHVTVTRSGTSMRLFVNGVQQGTTQTISTAYNLGTTSTTIGSQGTTYYLNGYISDCRVIKGVALYTSNFVPPTQTLTNYSTTYPSSLLLNFTNGGIVDQHSTNLLENVNGSQLSTSVKKYNNGSLSFSSASTQYLFMSGKMNAFQFQGGDFTIEVWINISDTTNRKYILGPGTDTASHYKGFGLEIYNQQLCMWASSNGSSWDLLECDTAGNRGSTLLSSGTWYHIAVTRSGNVYRSFINGTVEKTFTVSGSIYFDATIPYNIGRTAYQSGNFYFNGYMDDLRVTKGYARYTSSFTAPTSALITK